MPFLKLEKNALPAILREIPQPPKNLYLEGELPAANENVFLAVVGSRKYSAYGKDVCRSLIEGLAGQAVVVVSGLALGIDTIAHEAALAARLKTIAIPGSGLDRQVLYPSINRRLADRILAAGGCLLSESEPLERATVWSFPRRNRLMAGLAQAVLVIEATEKSGTLITARMALDYNRDVLAVPGSIFSPSSFGTNRLIKQGATPISSPADLLEALHLEPEPPNDNRQEELLANLSAPEKKIVELLKTEPRPRDEILRSSDLSASETNSILMILEIKGLIKETGSEIHLS
jgi:DNA processing protein